MREKSKPESAEGAEALRLRSGSGVDPDAVTRKIIGAAIEVHRHLGPGLLESAYEESICYELGQADLAFVRQVHIPVKYKGMSLDCKCRLDLVVEDAVIVEMKAIDALLPVHSAQLLSYLKATHKRVGLLINFNVPVLKSGLKRLVNHHTDASIARNVSAPFARQLREDEQPDILLTSSLRSSPRLGVSAANRRPQ